MPPRWTNDRGWVIEEFPARCEMTILVRMVVVIGSHAVLHQYFGVFGCPSGIPSIIYPACFFQDNFIEIVLDGYAGMGSDTTD